MNTNNKCMPICTSTQYYNTNTNICQYCDINCKTCINTSTTCTTCQAGYYLIANNTCSNGCIVGTY